MSNLYAQDAYDCALRAVGLKLLEQFMNLGIVWGDINLKKDYYV